MGLRLMTTSDSPIPLFKVFLAPEAALIPRLRDVLYSGSISEGDPVYQFEREFAQFAGLPNVLSFYSGTAALHVALILAGVRSGDDVISTPMTAEPTNMAIRHAGGTIVWADVDPKNGNLSARSIRERLTPRTRAIMVVHYGGIPASMKAIREVADDAGLPVIEDAAHALGARYANHPIGTTSEYAMFSLQAIKHMTTVDGGMLACKNAMTFHAAEKLRWFGIDRMLPRVEVDIKRVGYKYHMNNVNATIGRVQLEYIKPVLARHIENGRYFDSALQGIDGLDLCCWDEEARPCLLVLHVLAERRDELSKLLTSRNIGNSIVHRRNDWHTVFSESKCELPGLDSFYSRMLHIPCGWWLSPADCERIVDVIKSGW